MLARCTIRSLGCVLATMVLFTASAVHAQGASIASSAPGASSPPRLLHFEQAEYPAEATQAGLEASVILVLTIEADGHVSNAELAAGAGHGFDEAAIAAARLFQFSPAQSNGQPIAARIRYRYRFTLHASSAPPAGPLAIVRGTVRDVQNRAVVDADVELTLNANPAVTVRTDSEGAFRFELSAVGTASVEVIANGFRPFRAEETANNRDDVQVVYRLVALASSSPPPVSTSQESEQGVTVRTTRPPREVTRTTLEREEITRVPGAGGDAIRSIQNLPSVARPPALLGDLIVRGSAPGDTAVFVDGTDLPLLYHFSGAASVIPTEMLERIDFYPGNFSARYGRATGGIVDVGLRSPTRTGYHAVVQASTLDASVFAEGAITPTLSVALAARRSYVDAFLNYILQWQVGGSIVAAPVYWDYQAIIEWRPTTHMKLRLSFLGDDDVLNVLFRHPDDSMPTVAGRFSLATRFHLGQLLWTHDIAPGTQQRAMLSIGWSNTEFSGQAAFTFRETQFPIDFRYELSHTVNRFIRFNTGLDVQIGPTQEQFVIPRLDDDNTATAPHIAATINANLIQPAWYAELELTPLPGLRIIPGIRADFFSQNNQAILEPRVAARWEFIRTWTLKAGVGLYPQPPAFDQTTTAPNTLIPGQTIGNPHLAIERSMHYALGLEHAFSSFITLAIEGFYKSIDSIPVAASPYELLQQPPAQPYSSTGIGRVYGVDVLLRHRFNGHLFGWVAYTLMRSERRDSPTTDWYPFDYDQTHILTVVASYLIGWGVQAGLRFRYVTGTPSTPIAASYYNADTFLYTPIEGARNSVRNADFHQLDLRLDKTFRFHWGSFSAFVEVINVYNQPNQEAIQYNYNYRQHAPVTGLPIFPNIGLRGEI